MRRKNNKQNKNKVPKKIVDKEINQIKQSKTAFHLGTKDQDKINYIICFYLQKMRQNNNKQNKK